MSAGDAAGDHHHGGVSDGGDLVGVVGDGGDVVGVEGDGGYDRLGPITQSKIIATPMCHTYSER